MSGREDSRNNWTHINGEYGVMMSGVSGREDNNWTHINAEYVVTMRGVHRSLSSS